ncbi:hypothetical protein D9M71_668410 [compost metagenome]
MIALPNPVDVVRLETRCHVMADVPAVLWLMFTRRSPTFIPTQDVEGEPKPAPVKKPAVDSIAA